MEIKESRTSLINQFIRLLNKYCPDLIFYDDDAKLRAHKKHWFFKGESKVIIFPSFEYKGEPLDLFHEGEFEDITINVLDEKYFDCVKKVAEEWEKKSHKKTTVVKAS
jgi:hypothetical protein